MLPDFPAVKAAVNGHLTRFSRSEMFRHSPVLAEVSHIRQHEGRHWEIGPLGSEQRTEGFQRIETEMVLSRDEMRSDFATVLKKFSAMAEERAKVMATDMFQRISEAVDGTGNAVDARGKLTKEVFLDAIEKVQTDFDPETKQPKNQIIVMHPDVMRRIGPEMEEWEKDPDFKKRAAEIREKQMQDWRDRESRRRLVD